MSEAMHKVRIVMLCVAAGSVAVVGCGGDDAADEAGAGLGGVVDDGTTVTLPDDFPIAFPPGGVPVTVEDPESPTPIESVVMQYPDGDIAELTDEIRRQLPPATQETGIDGTQTSFVADRVIVNVSQQPDGVWISVSAL